MIRLIIVFLLSVLISGTYAQNLTNDQFLTYTVDINKQNLQFFWKDDHGNILGSIQSLKNYVESKNLTLTFAMNGGMFNSEYSPQGLFIQNGKTLSNLDTKKGNGNFYLMPNGVFYITSDNIPHVCETSEFADNGKIKYATQSGPMLIVNGHIHSAFRDSSKNLNIRNGVGILPDNNVVFVMSKKEINFYSFAKYFQSLGCKNALYLDGYVSRAYLPEKNWIQLDGNFGVLIGIIKTKK